MKNLLLSTFLCCIGWLATGQNDLRLPAMNSEAKPWSKLPLNNDPDKFQFAIVTDRTGGHRPGVFEYGVSRLNLLQPEFVLSVGDLIEGYTEDTLELNRQWAEFNGFINQLEMPFFYVTGNHDYTNPVMVDLWRKQFGVDYYHFVYKNVLFLCLNSEDGATALKNPDFGEAQVAFVKKVLDDNPNVRWTLVFMHQPLWLTATAKNWQRVEEMLSARKHSVFTGHLHQYALHDRNRTDYFVLATTGGGSRLRGKKRGEFDHIMWVTMTDKGPYYANILLDGIEDKSVMTAANLSQLSKLDDNPPVKIFPVFYDSELASTLPLKLSISNNNQVAQKINITFEDNPALLPEQKTIEKTLQAGQQEEMTVSVKVTDKVNFKPLVANIFLQSETYEWDSKISVSPNQKYTLSKAKKALTVDGDLKDWGKLRFAHIGEKGDGNFRFDVREDGNFLYVGIDVEDEDYQAGFGHSQLNQDGAFFIFDARPVELSAFNQREESGLFRGEWMFLAANPSDDTFELGFKEMLPPGVLGKGKRTATGYMVEYAVPVALLNKMQGADWKNIRLNVTVLDKDKDQKEATQYNWLPDWTENVPGSGTFFRE